MSSLICFDLRNNQISRLPPEICQLTSLKYLYLQDNHLTDRLVSLRCLDLRRNPIKILPDSFADNPEDLHYYIGFVRLPKWRRPIGILL